MLLMNEWRFLIRQPLTIVAWPVLALFAWAMSTGLSVEDSNYLVKVMMKLIGLIMMTLPIYVGLIAPISFFRDQQSNMGELVNVTAVPSDKRWWARFWGLVSFGLMQFSVAVCVVIIYAFFAEPVNVVSSVSAVETVTSAAASANISNYIASAAFFVGFMLLPSLMLMTALSLKLARTAIFAQYVVFMLLFLVLLVAASYAGSPILAGSSVINETYYFAMIWLDPYGFTALIDTFDVGHVVFSSALISNRILYVVLALLLAASTIKSISKLGTFESPKNQAARASRKQGAATDNTADAKFDLSSSTRSSSHWFSRSPFMTMFVANIRLIAATKTTQLILLFWPILIAHEIFVAIEWVEPFSKIAPNSIDALNRVLSDVVPIFSILIVLIWSWLLSTENHRQHIHELIATTRTSSTEIVIAQLAVLWVFILILMTLVFVGGSIAEWLSGSYWLPNIYFTQLSAVALPLMLLASIFVALQHVIRNKIILGVSLFAILILKFSPIATKLGLTHTLWNIAGSPLQPADHFWGMTGSETVFWPYMQFWLAFATGLFGLAIILSHRTTFIDQLSFRKIVNLVRATTRTKPYLAGVSVVALSGALVLGLLLDKQLVEERPLTFSEQREAWKAEYEKTYQSWADEPQPSIVNVASIVDFYPDAERADFNLKLTLSNQTDQAIKQILIGRYGNASPLGFVLEQPTLGEITRAPLGLSVIKLNRALAPNESIAVHTKFTYKQPQVWPAGLHKLVKPDFSYIRGMQLMPSVGFQPYWLLQANSLRAQHDLPEFDEVKPSELFATGKPEPTWHASEHWASYQSVVSTEENQVAVANGELVDEWNEDGRRYFKYATIEPMRPIPSWFSTSHHAVSKTLQVALAGTSDSANFNESTLKSREIHLSVYAPEAASDGRKANIAKAKQLTLKAMADTLEWFEQNIGVYPYAQLNLYAAPGKRFTGYALPQNMLINFRNGFLTAANDYRGVEGRFDQRYRRVVHETAHQWFGHGIGNGVKQDGAFLIESLAKYAELVLIEKHYGNADMQALIDYETLRYERAERHYYEANLSLVDGTASHINYSGATIAFAKLRALIGDEPIIATLKQLWQQHRYPKRPATSMDFVRILKQNLATKLHKAVDVLFLEHLKVNNGAVENI